MCETTKGDGVLEATADASEPRTIRETAEGFRLSAFRAADRWCYEVLAPSGRLLALTVDRACAEAVLEYLDGE